MVIPILIGLSAAATAAVLAWWLSRRRPKPADKPSDYSGGIPLPLGSSLPPPVQGHNLDAVVSFIIGMVRFSRRRIQIGVKEVEGPVIGIEEREVPYPADSIDVRPIRDLSELGDCLPEERLGNETVQTIRMLSGDSLVMTHLEERPLHDTSVEPVYRELQKALYVLLDISPSMFEEHGWAIPYWKGGAIGLLEQAIKQEAVFLIRFFGDTVSKKFEAKTAAEADVLANAIRGTGAISGTDIAGAIKKATEDLVKEEYEESEIVIITDGEASHNLDPRAIRERLDKANIKLHAVLFGVKNKGLQSCTNSYLLIPAPGVVKPLVRQK